MSNYDTASTGESPKSTVRSDAKNRAWRTLVNGLGTDLAVATAVAIGAAVVDPNFAWSGDYWKVVGLTVAKTGIMTVVAYVMRLKVSPTPPTEGTSG